jgi:cell division protein FtsQ
MDRSRRQGAKESATIPPSSSRLTFKAKRNRKRIGPLWTRLPKPVVIADACGRALRRSLPALVGVGVLAAVGGSAWAGYRFVTTSPRFAITEIVVHGNQRLTSDDVRAALPVHVGDNVFASDLDSAMRSLRADPWIATARAYRVLPHTLAIELTEHAPVAIVELGELYLIDAEGHAFKRVTPTDDVGGFVAITGVERIGYLADEVHGAEQLRAVLGALDGWRANSERPKIDAAQFDARGTLTLRTADGALAVELGAIDDALAARMQIFDVVWASLTPGERANARVLHLDTRSDHVTVAFR